MAETKIQWSGRLGVEVVGKVSGCCIKSILKWNPRMLGTKAVCLNCNSTLKAVRAGDDLAIESSGGVNDFRKTEAPEVVIGGLFFDAEKYASEEDVADWLKDREVDEPDCVTKMGDEAFYAPIENLADGTHRYVKVGMGVVAEVGLLDKHAAVVAGGGQGSMATPSPTGTSMATGGMVDPAQSPGQRVAVTPMPTIIKGMTEQQDNHSHEINLVACQDTEGIRVKGMTSFVNGHCHMVEAALNKDGTLDTRTAPDQAIVGGHAHQHRIIWRPGMSEPVVKEEKPPVIETFKTQLAAAMEKAKGKYRPAPAATK